MDPARVQGNTNPLFKTTPSLKGLDSRISVIVRTEEGLYDEVRKGLQGLWNHG